MENTQWQAPIIHFDGQSLPNATYLIEFAASLLADFLSDEARHCGLAFHYNLDHENPKMASLSSISSPNSRKSFFKKAICSAVG